MRRDFHLRRRLVAGWLLGALFIALSCLANLPLSAQAGSPPPRCPTEIPGGASCLPPVYYGHSYYITDPTKMSTLAAQDASYYSNQCTYTGQPFLTLLDFGRPGFYNGVYSVYNWGNNGEWLSYTLVVGYSEQYAQDWYRDATSCPSLFLVVGTNNSYECFLNGSYDPSCNVYTAGVQWDEGIHGIMNFTSKYGYSARETVWGGDDMEAEWDQWLTCAGKPANPQTYDFANGVAQQEKTYFTHAWLADYGDADYEIANEEGQCNWNTGATDDTYTYDASWGIGWDVPFPELYTAYQGQNWVNVYNDFKSTGYSFYGSITQCSEADPLPTGDCYVARNGDCEFSPTEAFHNYAIYFNPNSALYEQDTNQQWQTDGHTGNGTC